MSRRVPQLVLVLAIAAFALVSLAGSVFAEGTPVHLQLTAAASGALMLVAGWLILRANRTAVPLLVLAAAVYFLSMVVPAYSRHGTQLFAQLIPAFYLSMVIRLGFALLAHFLLNRVAVRA